MTESFNREDVEILDVTPLHQGFFKMNRYRLRHRLFAGGWSNVITREVFERGHAAVLLPYDPHLDQVVILEQFRVGAMENSRSPWLMELVAGIIEPGESARQVAYREAAEESGLKVQRSEHLYSYLASPGGCTERLDIFVGQVDSGNASGLHGLDEEDEDIRVHAVSRKQAFAWLSEGRIDNAATIIALQWLQLHGDRLRRDWLKIEDRR